MQRRLQARWVLAGRPERSVSSWFRKGDSMPLSSEDFEVPKAFRFRMVIAYEDLVTGQRAIKVYQRLKQHSMAGCRCQHSLWKFKDLDVPASCEAAAEDMPGADVALISTH